MPLPEHAPGRTTVDLVEAIGLRGSRAFLTATSATGSLSTVSCGDLPVVVARTASHLAGAGVRNGDTVGLHLDNRAGLEATVLHLAIHWLGAVAVPVSTRLSEREVGMLVDHADLRLIVTMGNAGMGAVIGEERGIAVLDCTPGLDSLMSDPRDPWPVTEHDLADILYTSGTTGAPKGVEFTHGNCVSCGMELQTAMRLEGTDVLQSSVPFFSSTGAHTNPLAALVSGCHYVIETEFDQARTFRTLRESGTTVYFGVPAMLTLLAREDGIVAKLPAGLKRVVFGGSVTTKESLDRLTRAFPNRELVNLYGLTEAGPGGTRIGPEDIHAKPGSVGRRGNGDNTFFRVVREDDTPSPPREVGQITIRSPAVMRGYHKAPDATAAALRGGWLHTGDYGHVDEDGYLWYDGRRDDLLIRGGFNIAAGEVEAVLESFDGINEAAVIGIEHEVLGQDLVAFVVLRADPLDRESLQLHLRAGLADYKIPRRVEVLDRLPRNAMGKVTKHALPAQGHTTVRLGM